MQSSNNDLQIQQIAQSIRNLPLEDYDLVREILNDEERKKRRKLETLQSDIERWQKTDKWLRENRFKYAGQWVCLDGDRLVAHGNDALEVDAQAQAMGIKAPLLEHITEELPWGGW